MNKYLLLIVCGWISNRPEDICIYVCKIQCHIANKNGFGYICSIFYLYHLKVVSLGKKITRNKELTMYMVLECSICFSRPWLLIPKWVFLENVGVYRKHGLKGIYNDKMNIVWRDSLKHWKRIWEKCTPLPEVKPMRNVSEIKE